MNSQRLLCSPKAGVEMFVLKLSGIQILFYTAFFHIVSQIKYGNIQSNNINVYQKALIRTFNLSELTTLCRTQIQKVVLKTKTGFKH